MIGKLEVRDGRTVRVHSTPPPPVPRGRSAIIVPTQAEGGTEGFCVYLDGTRVLNTYPTLAIAVANANANCDGPITIRP